jgi:hypothetical protein
MFYHKDQSSRFSSNVVTVLLTKGLHEGKKSKNYVRFEAVAVISKLQSHGILGFRPVDPQY